MAKSRVNTDAPACQTGATDLPVEFLRPKLLQLLGNVPPRKGKSQNLFVPTAEASKGDFQVKTTGKSQFFVELAEYSFGRVSDFSLG